MSDKKYPEFKTLDLPAIDNSILSFWEENRVFEKSYEERDAENAFVFYEGPPSANGKPGIHHVLARTIKDLFCRYQTMKGKRVERKGGWDTHGLPIELKVESELGITKEDIGSKISVDEYNKQCRETVMRFKDLWDDITRKMGYWVDLDDPYITFKNEYIESVWHILNTLYNKDLMYKGYTVQPFSPAAGTGLSSHELNLPGTYKEVKDTSAVAQFKIIENEKSSFLFKDKNEGDLFFIAWTTTPWTLPSNTALAVGAKIDYVRVSTLNPYTKLPINIILAKDLVSKWFNPEFENNNLDTYNTGDKHFPYTITGEYKGIEMEWISYEQLLPYAQPEEGDAFKVLVGDFVSTEDGTGIVHIAPSFGADDMKVAKKYGIGALTLVDKQGKFVDAVSDFAGRYVKDYREEGDAYRNVDIDISIKLKEENKAFNVQKYVHNYPHCWRTDKPILYYPLDSWFVRASSVRERMSDLNKTINWKPAKTGTGRFGAWLDNLQDWNLSRSRFWGIPLPIWRNEDASVEKCIGSIEELQVEIKKANEILGMDQSLPKDLHRPYIDDVILVTDTGEKMVREKDLIDVWFDSGSMPYAQWHYPFENKEKFQKNYPADFISEGVDQTRGWFYSLHAIAAMTQDSVAFKNVVSTGLVLDKNGQKMSKRLGNAVDPFTTIEKYGADATRWYMISNANPWDNLKFDIQGIEKVRRKFFGTLYNTYSFFSLYANIDGFNYSEDRIPITDRVEIDRWIISQLNSLIQNVDADYADYEPTKAARKIQKFVEEHLSNWYVRLCRRRFWKGEYSHDKIAAYQTLYECMLAVAKLMSPIAPFFGDWLYQNLNNASKLEQYESVHLSDYPKANAEEIDQDLEIRMNYAQKISSMVLSLRKEKRLRVRQPLPKILLPVLNDNFKRQVVNVKDLILAEVNIKDIEFVSDTAGIIKKKVKANFKTLGRRLGKQMKEASQLIAAMTDEDIRSLESQGKFTLSLSAGDVELVLEDFIISSEDIPGWLVTSDGELTVALDIQISPELKAEGMARELVKPIQNLRKSQDFNITDKVVVFIEDHEAIQAAINQFYDYICEEVLAVKIVLGNVDGMEKVELIDDIHVGIKVELHR